MAAATAPVSLSADNADELLSRRLTPPLPTDDGDALLSLDETYEIDRTAQLLTGGDFRTVALQFPDDLLHVAAEISKRLTQKCQGRVRTAILADTTYGSCCVDEVAAEHMSADLVVHYGRACLSPVTRLPVIYVFGRRHLALDSFTEQFTATFQDKQKEFLLMCDSPYAHSLDPIYSRLTSLGYAHISRHPVPDTTGIIAPNPSKDPSLLPSTPSLPDTTLILVAEPRDVTSTLLAYHTTCPEIYTFAPSSSTLTLSSPATNALLRRRYLAVNKARDASTVGIVISTVGKQGYLPLISKLRALVLDAGKKPYLLSLGKINPAKLANFADCDVFAMIACPDSTVVDARDFFKPIVTPYELFLALTAKPGGAPSWGGPWISDFERVLSLHPDPGSPDDDDDSDVPHFSLVTGKLVSAEISRPLRVLQKRDVEYEDENGALVQVDTRVVRRGDGSVVVRGVRSLAAERLLARSWTGLDGGEDASEDGAVVEIGRVGVARGYGDRDSLT